MQHRPAYYERHRLNVPSVGGAITRVRISMTHRRKCGEYTWPQRRICGDYAWFRDTFGYIPARVSRVDSDVRPSTSVRFAQDPCRRLKLICRSSPSSDVILHLCVVEKPIGSQTHMDHCAGHIVRQTRVHDRLTA